MDRLLGIMTGMSLALIAMVLFDVRRAHIRVEYSVTWLSAAVFVLVLSRSRWALDQLAGVLGIGYPPLAIVILAAFAFLVVFYRFSVIISDLKDANIALAQKVAIIDCEMNLARLERSEPVNKALDNTKQEYKDDTKRQTAAIL